MCKLLQQHPHTSQRNNVPITVHDKVVTLIKVPK